jgi:GAF domain-containing protein
VVLSLAEAVVQLAKYSVSILDASEPGAIPANDEERVAELARLHMMEGTDEKVLDRITQKVARIFEVPIALISFVDRDRQWFKSAVGLPPDFAEGGQTPRDISVCGHVIAGDASMVVEDLARDRRFANNALVKEHGLRFYAGAPIRSNGFPIGSLCILDIKPRRLTDREKRILEVIAEDVTEEIEHRATTSEPRALVA